MKKLKKSRLIIDIVLMSLILIIALSNIFASKLEIIFKLKPNLINTNSTQVHFIDVGQGDAIAINFSDGKTMLIDSGTEDYRKKLTNYLDNVVLKGSKKIDYLLLTHPDSDHSSNMAYIVENYEVGTFYRPVIYEKFENKTPNVENIYYRKLLEAVNNKNVKTVFNSDDLLIKNGDIKIDWIMPIDVSTLDSTNESSPALIIEDNGIKVFLGGDISEDVEEEIIKDYNNDLIDIDIDILKLSHHGSKYSNSYKFLVATSPKYVVGCVGENTYGHVSNDVIDRLLKYDEEFDCKLYSSFLTTKDDGNIIYTLEKHINVETIKNIDDYVFVSYWVYSLLVIITLIIVILIPHARVWYQNIRFIIRNKKHSKNKLNESIEEENN